MTQTEAARKVISMICDADLNHWYRELTVATVLEIAKSLPPEEGQQK